MTLNETYRFYALLNSDGFEPKCPSYKRVELPFWEEVGDMPILVWPTADSFWGVISFIGVTDTSDKEICRFPFFIPMLAPNPVYSGDTVQVNLSYNGLGEVYGEKPVKESFTDSRGGIKVFSDYKTMKDFDSSLTRYLDGEIQENNNEENNIVTKRRFKLW